MLQCTPQHARSRVRWRAAAAAASTHVATTTSATSMQLRCMWCDVCHLLKIWSQWCTHQIGGQRISVFAGVSGYSRQISVGNAPVCDLSVAYWGIMDLSVVYEGAQLIIWSLLHQYRIKNYQIDHL